MYIIIFIIDITDIPMIGNIIYLIIYLMLILNLIIYKNLFSIMSIQTYEYY